jgi:RNA polymerase sigma-70 factor (ECF subfamily)
MSTVAQDLDLHLVEAILQGRQEALEELYSRHARGLWVYLRHYIRDPQTCAELRDEVFVEVWVNASKYRARGSLKSWIYGIARHKAFDHVAQARSRAAVALDENLPDGSDPETLALQDERFRKFQAALGLLDDDHRSVLLLAFVGDLSYADIAQALDCPVNTVKTRIFYARRKLQEILAKDAS